MEDLELGLRELFVAHGAVGGAEINRAGLQLADAAAGADGLIIDLNIGMRGVVDVEPFGIDGVGERSAGGVEKHGSALRCGAGRGERHREHHEPHNQQGLFHVQGFSSLLFFDCNVTGVLHQRELGVK